MWISIRYIQICSLGEECFRRFNDNRIIYDIPNNTLLLVRKGGYARVGGAMHCIVEGAYARLGVSLVDGSLPLPDPLPPKRRRGLLVGIYATIRPRSICGKKYAFVSDYVRLWALEQEGGLYMDVDF